MINKSIIREYKRMHGNTGGIVGEAARIALDLARARYEYDRRDDVDIRWEYETESYESVYGEPATKDYYYCVSVWINNSCCASLGMVDSEPDSEYGRIIENEVLLEAFACEPSDEDKEAELLLQEQESNYLRGLGI